MITGYNTDIEFAGRVYHIQTEDKGLENPVVESLIYSGGEIVTSRRSSYSDLVDEGQFSEERVQQRMERQHQDLLRDVRLGKFDSGTQMPVGHQFVTSRSFNEVVDDYLREQGGEAAELRIRAMDWQVLEAGTRPTLRLTVQDRGKKKGVSGARVRVVLEADDREPQELFSSETDDQGFIEASFQIPDPAGESAQIVCEATLGDAVEQFRQRVKSGA